MIRVDVNLAVVIRVDVAIVVFVVVIVVLLHVMIVVVVVKIVVIRKKKKIGKNLVCFDKFFLLNEKYFSPFIFI